MPSFLIYAPDYPESLAKRLSVRPEHVELIHKDIASGQQEFGRPFYPPADAKPHGLPEGTPNIGGSFMVWNLPSREAVWERIKQDAYWRHGVWDKERTFVEEFLPPPPAGHK